MTTDILNKDLPKDTTIDASLLPKQDRNVGPISYIFMWIGDGVNLGNMTLGSALVLADVAQMNMYQTFIAAIIAIGIISAIFTLNDRCSYRTGIPYVVQLRMSFGIKGSIISSLLRGIPAIIWYGFQSWLGATALNEIAKVFTDHSFDNIFICFLCIQGFQIIISQYGFHAVKWIEIIVSIVILTALVYIFYLLLTEHRTEIVDKWVNIEGTWGIKFWGFIMAFLGNYAAIFLSAGDYSRELKKGISDGKRGFLYFLPILIAYGFVLTIGVMLATATGISNPVQAFPIIVNNEYITVAVSAFIVLGAIGVNMVANIIPPTYVITNLTGIKYKYAVTITGLLAIGSFPWVLVQESSSMGLTYFVLTYSAFLGPIVAILLIDYYIFRKQKIDVNELYKNDGLFSGFNSTALIAMFLGAIAAFIQINLAWIIGFIVGGLSYYLLTKYTQKNSPFKKGTIFEKR